MATFATWAYQEKSKGRIAELHMNVIWDPLAKEEPIRASWLQMGDHTAFGDKEVHHYKMEYIPKPIQKEEGGFPESLTTSISYDAGDFGMVGSSSGGINNLKAHFMLKMIGKENFREQEFRVQVEEDERYIRLRGYSRTKWYWDTDWGDWFQEPGYDIAYYDKVLGVDKFNTRQKLYVNRGPVEYEFPIFRGDWLSHMKEIRPFAVSDAEALSECVRSTISDQTTLNSNNIANALEFIDLVKDIYNGNIGGLIDNCKGLYKRFNSFVSGSRKLNGKTSAKVLKKVSKAASKGWLSYRYAYNTTKMDVEQQIRAAEGEFLGKLDKYRVLRGQIPISNGRLRVKMRLHDKVSPNFMKFEIRANQVGMFPGLYELWDLLPFSFVGDWFAPLGDYLKDIEEQFLYANYYQVDELLVSKKQELVVDEPWGLTTYTWYERDILFEFPQLEIYEEPKGTSKKVKCWRSIDAASLVVGTF